VGKLKSATTDSKPEATPVKKITQREAVQRALAAGKDQPSEGVVFVKESFGIELNKQAFSTLKSQLKSAAGKPSEPRQEPAVPAAPNSNGKRPSDAVELARAVKLLVQQHGAEAMAEMAGVFAD
jgi:hypothetical protein